LTISKFRVIVAHINFIKGAVLWFPAVVRLSHRLHSFPKKTAGNSDKTANFSLFFALQNRRRSRISAATETPTADNLREKQRKQQKRRDVL